MHQFLSVGTLHMSFTLVALNFGDFFSWIYLEIQLLSYVLRNVTCLTMGLISDFDIRRDL